MPIEDVVLAGLKSKTMTPLAAAAAATQCQCDICKANRTKEQAIEQAALQSKKHEKLLMEFLEIAK